MHRRDLPGPPDLWGGLRSRPPSIPRRPELAEMSRGQAAFLVSLSPEQRAGLALRPGARALLLEWHRNGPDRVLQAEAARLMRPRQGVP